MYTIDGVTNSYLHIYKCTIFYNGFCFYKVSATASKEQRVNLSVQKYYIVSCDGAIEQSDKFQRKFTVTLWKRL